MKKITLLFYLLFFSIVTHAQIVASQDFNTVLGWTPSSTTAWSRQTVGTAPSCAPFGAGMARFYSYNLAAGTTARLTSPAITFAGANYRVKFKMYRDSGYNTDADRVALYYNTTGLAGGTLLGTVNRSSTLAPVVSEDGWYTYAFDIPGTLTGTGYVHFLGTSQYGNNIFIDDVVVEQIPALDAELSTVNIPAILPNTASNISISGTFKNFGSSPITSVDLNWQANSGTIFTQTLSGLNIAANQVYNYTHNTTWNPTPGTYNLKVWLSNLNGGSTEPNLTNNEINKTIAMASNSTSRFPLYEEFSSSTCNPCAAFNGTYFNPFQASNSTNHATVAYRVNWPGSGDPYYTAEVGTRVGYYSISGAPTLMIDGTIDGTNFSSTALQSDLDAQLAKAAYFAIDATKSLNGSDLTVNVTTTPYLTGTYRLFVAVVEKMTTGNVASNGETEFHDVFMKMLPNATGTVLNCTADSPITTTLNAALTGLHIEELTDLDVVVFVQDYTNKMIMQSKVATDALSNNQFENKSISGLYPNPSNGMFKIKTNSNTTVSIVDVTGKTVFTNNNLINEQTIDLSSLQKGIYLAKINNENGELVQKIVIK